MSDIPITTSLMQIGPLKVACYALGDSFSRIANIPEDLIYLGLVMSKCQ